MNYIELTAPAKVNIFLRILSKRKDSYHNILTLFERISLRDMIKISKIPKGIVLSSDVYITRDPKDNVAYKAAELLLKKADIKSGVRIRIKKRIPIAAGLGGGSSDAASVLAGINRLFGLKLNNNILMNIGKKIGADVPFFLLKAPFALAKARGDDLEEVRLGLSLWHLIIFPGFGLPTKDVYRALDLALTRPPDDVKIHFPLVHSMDFESLEPMLCNDLEETVVAKEEIVGNIIERLASSLGKKAIISGSGPSVFCLYKTRKEAIGARKRLYSTTPASERKFWRVFIAETKV